MEATDQELCTLKRIVYLITNRINNKKLVGQTINTFHIRYAKNRNSWVNHISNRHFSSSLRKYGPKNFMVEILHHGIPFQKELDELEDYYIVEFNTLNPKYGYNKKRGGANGKPSDHTKRLLSEISRTPLGEYIERANKTHNNKYDYSEVNYSSLMDRINIKCPTHGWFRQIAMKHVKGNQCPSCATRKHPTNDK